MTIDELQALPDKELNALAAKLRGWGLTFGGIEVAGEIVREHHFEGRDKNGELGAIISVHDWTPATSHDQSRELLQWAGEIHCLWFGICVGSKCVEERVSVYLENGADKVIQEILVPGNDARAETIAFCAAMLAIEGETNG